MRKRVLFSVLLILVVLICDQALKIYVKTTMPFESEYNLIGTWFKLHFTENPGFAFGTVLPFKHGKLVLSLFRLAAIIFIGFYLIRLIRNKQSKLRLGYILMIALIWAGATGNVLDSTFYGLLFSESGHHGHIATLFSDQGGYAGLFHGKVVDMFHLPIVNSYWPDWVPYFGGSSFEFFRPIFNIADASISIGVLGILFFYRGELKSLR